MSGIGDCFPPEPVSYYKQHDMYDWYFKREDRLCKKGQPWDLFSAWGQQRLLLDRENGVTVPSVSRLPMSHRALTCTVPTLPANTVAGGSIDPCIQPLKEQRELLKMKEALLYRIALTKRRRRKYGQEVTSIKNAARNLVRQIRKQLQMSPPLSPASSSADHHTDGQARKKRTAVSFEDSVADSYVSDDEAVLIDTSIEGDHTEALSEGMNYFTREHPLVKRVLCDMYHDPRLFADINIPIIPTQYLGGCLSSARSHSGQHFIAHSTGSDMSNISVKQVSRGDEFSELSLIGVASHTEPVQQVELKSYGAELMVACRSRDKFSVYDVQQKALTCRDVVRRPNIGHVALSPYFPEALVVCGDSIYRWNEHSQFDQLFTGWSPRFPVTNPTKTVHFGCHPRQIVMTDPSVCSLYDTRLRSRTESATLDLFEVPSNTLLQRDERLVTAAHSRDFTHHILAHHTLLSVDERFPKYPVLYQVLPCLTWPMLIDSTRLDSSRDLLLLGCPTNQEVFSMIIDNSSSVLKTTPLWKCSQPGDVCHFYDSQPSTADRLAVNSRLQSGLLGLAGTTSLSDDFTVHMLSSKGDLFEQTYCCSPTPDLSDPTHDLADPTLAAGPTLNRPKLPSSVSTRCRIWYDMITSQLDMKDKEQPFRQAIVIPKEDILPPHQACSVCGRRVHNNNASVDDTDDSQCFSCGLLTPQSKEFASSIESALYCELGSEGVAEPTLLTAYDPVEKAKEDANSKLLIKLWNEEDLAEELAARDQEWDERREKLVRDYAADGTLASSELDALSCVSGPSRRSRSAKSRTSAASRYSFSKNRKSLESAPGFVSPRDNSRADHGAMPSDNERMDTTGFMLSGGLNLTVTDSPALPSRPASHRKSRGRKGF